MNISRKLLTLLLISAMTVSTTVSASAVTVSNETPSEASTVQLFEKAGNNNLTAALSDGFSQEQSQIDIRVGYVTKLTAPNAKGLKWSSSNPGIASVDQKGNVMGISAGRCSIYCTSQDGKQLAAYTAVVTQPVKSVKLNTNSITWAVGKSGYFHPTVGPQTATNKNVTYKSSNPSVARVSSDGLLTAVGIGTCTVTCTSAENPAKSDTCTVTVNEPKTDIEISDSNIILKKGLTKKLTTTVSSTAAVKPTVSWSSSNKSVADVNKNGVVTAKQKGNCVITATTSDGKKAKAAMVVIQPINSISLSSKSAQLNAGTSKTLTASISPSIVTSKELVWESSNPAVATVKNGVVTAVGKGSCKITCKAKYYSNASAVCDVTVAQPVTKVTLNAHTINWNVGRAAHFYPTVTPNDAANTAVTYTSSNEAVATVSADGLLTAKSAGTCIITCTAADGSGNSDSCIVNVKQPVTKVTLNAHTINWNVGRAAHFYPTVTPDNATNTAVTYKSSNEAVATVSADGLLTAKSAGTCTITCTAADGSKKSDKCTVTVKQPVTKITVSGTKSIKAGSSTVLTAKVAPTNAANRNVTWSSSNTSIATVSSSGVVTAKRTGTVTIKCTAKDGSKVSGSIKITVTPAKSKGEQIADYAAQWVGVTPYVWGGTSLYTGADCSGFVCCVYEKFGYNLWGSRVDLDTVGRSVSLSNAKPGDIVVFDGHVAIYAGNGMVTHALNPSRGVMTTDISWGGNLRCVRRVVD